MVEVSSPVEPKRVTDVVQVFMSLDLTTRKQIAQTVLDKWTEVMDANKLVKDWLCGDEEEPELAEGEEAPPGAPMEIGVFLKALTVEEQGPFKEDFLAKLLLMLHWWTDEEIGSPLSTVPDDCYRGALEQILSSEEGLFVGHPNSPTWLSNMPQHAKDVFCVNMCCLDQAYQTQALDFLLPAFSLYPDKDYCIITQPHTAHNTPLLNAFTICPPQPTNTFG